MPCANPLLSFSKPFLSKIELFKPLIVKNRLNKKYDVFFLILGRSRTKIKRLRNADLKPIDFNKTADVVALLYCANNKMISNNLFSYFQTEYNFETKMKQNSCL